MVQKHLALHTRSAQLQEAAFVQSETEAEELDGSQHSRTGSWTTADGDAHNITKVASR